VSATERLLYGLAICGALSGCVAPSGPSEPLGASSEAITNGSEESGDPAVVALLDGEKTFCTGTLVAPRAVLTAGHCLSWKHPTAVYFGSNPPAGGKVVTVETVRTHPGFDPETLTNDLAVVVLARDASPEPVAMVDGIDESFVGREARLVGFGRTSPTDVSPLAKRTGTVVIDSVDATTFRYRPSPSHACFIDSGGPALVKLEREYIAGVTSAGDWTCSGSGTEMRIDSDVKTWIRNAVDAASDREASGGCAMARGPNRRGRVGLGAAVLLLTLLSFRRTRLLV
jgi:secreted trypsin-like serine protease